MATMEDHLLTQLGETREEISRAHANASIVLAAAGVVMGTVVAGLIAGDLTLATMPAIVLIIGVAAAVTALAGLAHTAAAIWPHCGKAVPGRARYFTEVATYATVDDLRDAI